MLFSFKQQNKVYAPFTEKHITVFHIFTILYENVNISSGLLIKTATIFILVNLSEECNKLLNQCYSIQKTEETVLDSQ